MAPRLRRVTLASEIDIDGFRAACRALHAAGIAPESVSWAVEGDPPSIALEESFDATPAPPPSEPLLVPGAFVELCGLALLHRDRRRFGLLYRLLWRLQREPGLRHDPLDPDRLEAERYADAVRHEVHRMHAFVRFRTVHEASAPGAPLAEPWHVAWFEPEHHIVEAAAPFFVRRFHSMRWAILTPERSARWDGRELSFGPGADPAHKPAPDAGEALWLTYYRSIFNPARANASALRREMPVRYWRDLPEAALIAPLETEAMPRRDAMIAKEPTAPRRARVAPAVTEPNQPDPAASEHPVSLDDLAQALDRCRECPLGALATQGVPGEGPRRARLMFVGEQPGDQEDLKGRPFVGPAGQLLDRAFEALGWPRDRVYVTNAVKHFKFELRGKRRIHKTPAQQEMAACLHWLASEIDLVQPEALVALGATAARQLIGRTVPVMRERGHWLKRTDGRRVLVTLHPSALLRADPEDREAAYAAWLEDLRAADVYFRDAR